RSSEPAAVARYAADGRGGLAGRYDGPEGGFEETLVRLADATTDPGLASARVAAGAVAGGRHRGAAALEGAVASGEPSGATALVLALDERGVLADALGGLSGGA